MTLYTDRKPREAVARALFTAMQPGHKQLVWQDSTILQTPDPETRRRHLEGATAVLNTLRELGFITSEGLDAIHAEEDANGEPRSSVVPGSGR